MHLVLTPALRSIASFAALVLALGGLRAQEVNHSAEQGAAVTVRVDATIKHQVMGGFGATTLSLVYGGFDVEGYDDQDNLPELRAKAIEALYGQVKLTMGNLQLPMLEQAKNDDDDPHNLNWSGFDLRESKFVKEKIVDLGKPYGFDNFQLANCIDFRRMGWMKAIRTADYNRYLDECAEHVLAGVLHWRDTYHIEPRLMMLFNEPLSGNRELQGGSTQEVVDIVKRAGTALRKAGVNTMKFVVPNEETEAKSLETATAILADPEARQYVGAIGYHPYPYGSNYASIPHLFRTSGKGAPDASKIELRRKLRDLGRQYNVPLWMSEVSHGEVPHDSMDALRGRAIHIHDELEYADAAAYFGMNAMWDTKSHREHTHGSRPFLTETDTVVLVDNEAGKVIITGIGYAIGHYARWISRGAVRVEATSSDPLVLASAFHDESKRRVALVLINNAADARRITVSLNGVTLTGSVEGEQSSEESRWKKLPPIAADAKSFTVTLPPQSVSSFAGGF